MVVGIHWGTGTYFHREGLLHHRQGCKAIIEVTVQQKHTIFHLLHTHLGSSRLCGEGGGEGYCPALWWTPWSAANYILLEDDHQTFHYEHYAHRPTGQAFRKVPEGLPGPTALCYYFRNTLATRCCKKPQDTNALSSCDFSKVHSRADS